jgi:hypothetical protein
MSVILQGFRPCSRDDLYDEGMQPQPLAKASKLKWWLEMLNWEQPPCAMIEEQY